MKRFISIAGFVVLTATSQAQNPVAQDIERVTVALSDPSRPGLLKITTVNGGMTVKTHNGKDVIIEGRSVGRSRPSVTSDGLRRISPGGAGLVIVEENNVITVSSSMPGAPGHLDIQVPAKTNLKLSTVNGSANVESVEGDLEVSNVNGEVRLNAVTGSVVAHAQNGNLFAVFRELANKPMSFTSMNGNVDVTLPASAKANLRIRSDRGNAWTDFDLQMRAPNSPRVEDSQTRGGGQFRILTDTTVNATINGGGTDLDVRTLNGNIFVRKAK